MKSLLLAGVAGCVLTAAEPTLAQEGVERAASEDIIVTARRTEERLQDVPISITVFNQSQITDRNIVVATDLATYTPSLSVNQKYGPEKASFNIRGFNQEPSTAPTVGVYFADVVGPRAQGGTTSGNTVGAGAFMDLQNVQVLKGPQGTLQGRNTTGGAVLLVPNKPNDRLEGWVEGQVGNYDMRRGQAMINLPLAETFKVRLAVDRNKRDGYMKNHSGQGTDAYNDVNYFAARFSVVADLTPDLENYTIFSYSNSFSNGFAARYVYCDPRYVVGSPQYSQALTRTASNFNKARLAPAACDQMDRQTARGDGAFDVEVGNPDPYVKLKQWQVINTTTWRASDVLTIKNIASYAEFRERSSFGLYSDNWFVSPRTGLAPPAFNPANVGRPFGGILLKPAGAEDNAQQSTFTEELQFQGGTSDGTLVWQAGAYLEMSRPLGWSAGLTAQFLSCATTEEVVSLDCAGSPVPGGGNMSASSTKYDFDNKGLYAQATYNFTEKLSLTGGFRYTFDKIYGQVATTRINFPAAGGIVRTCNDALTFPAQPATVPPTPMVVQNRLECYHDQTVKSDEPTWLVGIDYKPTSDVLFYAKYARGYRQGGLNFTNISLETWGPEKVDAYEVGAKASFRGPVSGYFNIAGFYNELSGQQVFFALLADPRSGIAGGAGVFNAGKSQIQGIEVDATATVFDNLRFDLGYTFLDATIKEIVVPTASFPYLAFVPRSNVGDPLTLSPKHRWTASATYTLPVDESFGQFSIGVTWIHTGKQIADGSSNPTSQFDNALGIANPAYGLGLGNLPNTDLLNINVNWNRALGSPFDAAFFMTNVTNEKYPVAVTGSLGSNGAEAHLMGMPRMYGFRLRYNFGE